MGEQEGEEESTVVAILTRAKRNARSNKKSGVRIGLSFSACGNENISRHVNIRYFTRVNLTLA